MVRLRLAASGVAESHIKFQFLYGTIKTIDYVQRFKLQS